MGVNKLSHHFLPVLACMASVSVGFQRSKDVFRILDARGMGREQKKNARGEGRGEGRSNYNPPPLPHRFLFLLSSKEKKNELIYQLNN